LSTSFADIHSLVDSNVVISDVAADMSIISAFLSEEAGYGIVDACWVQG